MKHRRLTRSRYFNSRPSARGDLRGFAKLIVTGQFQFTPLREGRPHSSQQTETVTLFQFTPLREGRQSMARWNKQFAQFQFTPLREGRRIRS